jgi:hypothetical protein
MNKIRLLILIPFLTLQASILRAESEQPPYDVPDSAISQIFQQVFLTLAELERRLNNLAPPSKTKAELNTTTPSVPGLEYYCSDCSTDGIVVSTGTTQGAFGRISARTTAIN